MKKTGWAWELYKLLFLDIWHRRFFNLSIKPQLVDFTEQQKNEYLKSLKIEVLSVDKKNQSLEFFPDSPTLFYGNHPSSLDALFVHFVLFARRPWFVSFLHNQLHFAFLKNKTIPVSAYFAAQKFTLLGMKMQLARRLENLGEAESKKMNLEVANLVAKKVLQKDDVVIFPSGGWGRWQDGIGFALDIIYEKNPSFKLNLQPLKIVSFRELHSVIHGWLHVLGIKVNGKVKIRFGQTKTLQEMGKQSFMKLNDRKMRARAIRSWLEDDYRTF